jgi:hypothetical protein
MSDAMYIEVNPHMFQVTSSWIALNRPPLIPTYIRNSVRVGADSAGQIKFRPVHQSFIVENDRLVLVGEEEHGWVNTSATLNPAEWPETEDLSLIAAIEPSVKTKIALLTIARGHQVGKDQAYAHISAEVTKLMAQVRQQAVVKELNLGNGSRVVFYENGAAMLEGSVPCKVVISDAGLDVVQISLGERQIVNSTIPYEKGWLKFDKSLCQASCDWYDREVSRINQSAKQLEDTPAVPSIPDNVQPISRALSELKLPASVKSAFDVHKQKQYNIAVEMAEALGYVVRQGSATVHGQNKIVEFVLAEGATPTDLSTYVVDFDPNKGLIYVEKANMGLVIGAKGVNIKWIEAITKRHWDVVESIG